MIKYLKMSSNNLTISDENSSHAFSETRKTFTDEKMSEDHSIPSKSFKKKRRLILDPKYKQGRWTDHEQLDFIKGIFKLGKNNWKKLEEEITTRTSTQIRSHAQKFLVKLLKKYNILSKLYFFSVNTFLSKNHFFIVYQSSNLFNFFYYFIKFETQFLIQSRSSTNNPNLFYSK